MRNLEEKVHRAIANASGSEETVILERRDGEAGADFMRRFEQKGKCDCDTATAYEVDPKGPKKELAKVSVFLTLWH